MQRRQLFIQALGLGMSIMAAGAGAPVWAKDKPKALAKATAQIGKKRADVEIYQSRNKNAYVLVSRIKGEKPKWVEFTASEDVIKKAFAGKKTEFTAQGETFVALRDGEGRATVQTANGAPVGEITARDAGAAAVVAVVVVVLVILYVTWEYGGGKEAYDGVTGAGEAIGGATGNGFWDDGSEHCNPGPLDPPVLC